ncbi:phage tail tape measure protein, TP901 family, core region [Paenibacillus polysaccharolyticus]|uniref:Phage tail tape measure protein, TP901 family, core region n=1 Tax=Paenibacillus polysaccharolyticus TaxID=582692 RepID=A0A1G5I6X5_9BACL|nr:phage tail tape measure protein [Paenibacillus polysaccharolyticus]SCY71876.1 phage tail tape measure protein, TP901 family, core region [Paenibacillus polysaccharolyticus]
MSSDVELNIATNQMITDLNKALREIASKMNSLKVKVDFDPSFLQGLTSYADGMNRLNHTMIENKMLMQSSLDEYKRMQINQERLRNMTAAETAAYEKQRVSIKRLEQELAGYTLTKDKAIKNHAGVITGYTKTYKDELGQLLTVNTNTSGQVKNYDKVMEYAAGQRRALNQKNLENQQREAVLSEEQSTRRALEQQTALRNAAKDDAHRQALQQNTKMNEDLRKSIAITEEKIIQASQKYNLNGKVSDGLKTLRSEMLLLNSSMSTVGYKATAERLAQLNDQLKATTRSSAGAGGEIKTLGEVMKGASAMAGGWMSNVTSLIQPMDVLRKAIQSIISMDGQMNQLERSIGSSFDEERMLAGSNRIAQSTGRSMSEVNGNLIGFANQGFDEADTLSLGKAASVLQNISSLTPAESVNTLSLAMASFNIEADKSMSIADKLKEVSGIYGVSSKDLALSLTSAGAAAKSFGVSIEELLGNTAAISSITRESGDVVGRGLKSIYTKLGSDEQSKGILESVGISKADKDVTTLLDELAGKWNQLTKAQQQNTALGLAGQDQTATFTALMQNWGTSLNASESALHSQGAAMKDNEIYMGSLGARIQNMQTAWEGLTLALGNALVSDTLITITSLVTGLLNWMSKLGNGFVGFGVAGIAVGLLSASLRILTFEIIKTVFALKGIEVSTVAASVGTKALSMSINILKNSFKALAMSLGVGALFAVLGTALEWIMGMFSSTTQATEDFSDKTEALNQKVYDLNGLKALSAEYETLTRQISLNYEEKTRLAQIESELASKYGIHTENVQGQTKSLDANMEAIKEKKQLLEDEIRLEREKAELAYNANATKIESEIADKRKEVLQRDARVDETKEGYLWGLKNMSTFGSYEKNMFEMSAQDYEEALALQQESNESLKALTTQKVTIVKDAAKAYIDAEAQKNVEIKKNTLEFMEIYAYAATQSGLSKDQINSNLGKAFEQIQNSDIRNPEQAMKFLNTLPGLGKLTADAFKEVNNSFMQMDFSGTIAATEKVKDNAQMISEWGEFASDTKQEFELLNQAQSELANNNNLSTATIQKMNEKYGDFIKVTGLSKEATLKFIQAEKRKKIEYINSEIEMTKEAIRQARNRIKITQLEIEAFEQRSKAANSAKISELSNQINNGEISEQEAEKLYGAYRRNNALYDSQGKLLVNNAKLGEYAAEKAIINEQLAKLNLLNITKDELTGTVNNGNKATKDSTSLNDKSNNSLKESIDLLTKLQLKIEKVDKSLENLRNKRRLIEPGSAAYRKSLMQENALLSEKSKLLAEGIKNPNKLIASNTEKGSKENGKSTGAVSSETVEAQSKASQEKEETDYQIIVNQRSVIDDVILESNNKITRYQNDRELSSNQQKQFTSDSVEWRKEEGKQSSLLQKEKREIEQQNMTLSKLLKDKKINSEEYNQKISENDSKIWALEEEIQTKRVNVVRSQMESYDNKIKETDYQLDLSNAKLKSLTEGTIEYNQALQDQIPILQHKKSLQQDELSYLEKQLSRTDLSPAKIAELTQEFNKLKLELYGTDESLKSINDQLLAKKEASADKIIEDYKKVIEQQRDLALDAIDEQRKAEDKRHEERNKNLDEEQKKFETYINARLKALDRENSSTDYAEELTKKKNERQKIVDKLNVLSLDNSMEAKAKRKDLTEQLTAVDEEIAKYERDRSREMVKQGLQDQLEDRKNYNDQLKEEEDKLNKDEIDKLDDKKKKTERHYKDILENEKSFYQLKQNLMSNDVAVVNASLNTIGEAYKTLFDGIRQHVFETSVEMENLIYKFSEPEKALAKFKAGDYSSSDSGSQTSSGSASSGSLEDFKIKGTTEARRDWTYYLDNKSKAENIRKEMGLYNKDSYKYQQLEKEFKKLQEENQKYRDKYQFPDNSYAELLKLKIFSADTGGLTPAFSGAKFLLAHEKELILNQSDTSNLLKIVDVVRGITERIKTGFDFGALKFSQNDVAGTTDNRIQIDKVEIVAKDQESGMSLLGKFEEALNNKLKLRTI